MPEWTPIFFRALPGAAALTCTLLATTPAPAQPPARTQSTGEVEIAVESFGAGAAARPGEWAGLRLALIDSAERPRETIVRVTLRDSDGDRPEWERSVATNPGFRQPVWVYFRLPFSFQSASTLSVAVYAAGEGVASNEDPALRAVPPGRLLGSATLPAPQRLLRPEVGMFGIVGRRSVGLSRYRAFSGDPWLPFGHEAVELVVLDPGALPDRWMGLAQFDVIAWSEGQPGQLSPDSAHALREWIRRGGHLVVILPRVGQTWTDEPSNPLYDVTPKVKITRDEAVDLAPYEPIIRRGRPGAGPLPEREIVHFFAPPADADWGETFPILSAPDGRCIAARRLEGAGAVTLIGLDVGARFFQDNDLPDADLFWHRILGRRGSLLRDDEWPAPGDRLRATTRAPSRRPAPLDRDFGVQIDKTGRAAAGVLAGFALFVTYWLVAGPLGFFVLRRSGLAHHSWIAFVAVGAVFTAIAWGGATAIRPRLVEAAHLTFLDHVYGQPTQHARSWVTLLAPVYGEAGISLRDPTRREPPAAPTDRINNAIAPWEPPGSESGGGFPDLRGYRIDSRSPGALTFPARSTVKQFQIDWVGGPAWSMPRPETPSDGEPAIRLLEARRGQPVLRGVLRHGLPGPLRDVVAIVVRAQKPLSDSLVSAATPALLSSVVIASRQPGDWAPGDPWDLSTITQSENADRDATEWLARLLGAARTGDGASSKNTLDPSGLTSRLNALAVYTQLDPPRLDLGGAREDPPLAIRTMTHGLDLGRWFTQPCLIVIGHLGKDSNDQPSPVPLYVDVGGGYRPATSRGRTVVRWVYPLASVPPPYPARSEPPTPEPGAGAPGR